MMAATLLDDQERVLEEVLRTSNRIIEQQVGPFLRQNLPGWFQFDAC